MASARRVISVMEKAKLVCWVEETNSLAMAARRYRAEFGQPAPKLETIKKLHQQFMETGTVTSSPYNSSQSPSATMAQISSVRNFYEPRL
uniref:DUF4817 domain-containing protein n=1 Tax=Panagrolaimus sp. PS1159 TaxID=55785 RepID=A0AC35GV43_9BILA